MAESGQAGRNGMTAEPSANRNRDQGDDHAVSTSQSQASFSGGG
jgi:hypothetical protein